MENIDLITREGHPVRGTLADPTFRPLVEAFVDVFDQHGETAASLCVTVSGRMVLDLWGGGAREDALYILRSASKGVLSALVMELVADGELSLDDPVCRHWPAFAANGKEAITVSQVMSHTAGLAVLDTTVTLDRLADRQYIAQAIERQAPQWSPGGEPGYHDHSYGWILSELLCRIRGQTLDELLDSSFRRRRGLVLHYGLPAELRPKLQSLLPANAVISPQTEDLQARRLLDRLADPDSLLFRSQCNPDIGPIEGNALYLDLQLGATNGVSDARSLARLYSHLLDSVGDEQRFSRRWTLEASGVDRLVGYQRSYSCGFMLPDPTRPMAGLKTRSFGFYGSGGSLAFAEVDRRLSFAYLTAQQQFHVGADPRSTTLARVAYACATI